LHQARQVLSGSGATISGTVEVGACGSSCAVRPRRRPAPTPTARSASDR